MKVRLSVALVTRNRPESLERTFISLLKQTVLPDEIIVSDDSDNETNKAKTKKIVEKFGFTYISGPQKGLYANRNFVAKHCTGTHIRTMDDDHEFPENHIQKCIAAINKDDQSIWTIGEYYPNDDNRPLPAPVPGQLHPRGFSLPPKDVKKYCGISCGASIYPRSVVDRNILNLEIFKFGMVYLEYGLRLVNKGFNIKHLDSTYIIHHYDENNRSISSKYINDSARIFSMFMLSFYYKKSFANGFLTLFQITTELIRRQYSMKLVWNAYLQYKKESSAQTHLEKAVLTTCY